MSDTITCPECGSSGENLTLVDGDWYCCEKCGCEWNQPERLLHDHIAALEAENAEKATRIADLKNENASTYCACCGMRFAVDAPDATDAVQGHISVCEKHPMRALESELRDCRTAHDAQDKLTSAIIAENAELRDAKAALDGMRELGADHLLQILSDGSANVVLKESLGNNIIKAVRGYKEATPLEAVTAALAAKEKGND